MRDWIICDLETASISDAEQYIEPIEAPSNYKKPEVIAEYIASATEKAKERCSLDQDLCRIVALGWQRFDDSSPTVLSCRNATEEKAALEYFWKEALRADGGVLPIVTFNGLRFDLPIVMRRSLYLHTEYQVLNLDKYRTPHVDLSAILTHNGTMPWHSLAFYLARFGIANDDVHTGKDIATLVREENWPAIVAHCEADVIGVRKLAERLGYLTTRQLAEVV